MLQRYCCFQAIVGGLVNFEGVNGQLIRLITQPLEDLFIQQGSAVTARKLPKGQQSSTISAVNALKLRILYVLMMKSGLLRENQVYSAITKDLVELSTACTFQIVDICNLYPQFFMVRHFFVVQLIFLHNNKKNFTIGSNSYMYIAR